MLRTMHTHGRDPRWDESIELLLAGASHKLVAERCGVHRNTVRNWLRDSAFRVELARRSDERLAEVKLRRAVGLTRAIDHLVNVASAALDAAERDPRDRRAQRSMLAWLRMYRKLRQEERLDAADLVHSDRSEASPRGILAILQELDRMAAKVS